jgi:hypothetical protein
MWNYVRTTKKNQWVKDPILRINYVSELIW